MATTEVERDGSFLFKTIRLNMRGIVIQVLSQLTRPSFILLASEFLP